MDAESEVLGVLGVVDRQSTDAIASHDPQFARRFLQIQHRTRRLRRLCVIQVQEVIMDPGEQMVH